jgi:hypothetical protein
VQNEGVGPRQYDSIGGPLLVLVVLLALVLICRWVFSTTDRDRRAAKARAALLSRGDFGLLVPIATVRTVDDAEALREVLAAQGIRATVSDDSGVRTVLVFRRDEDRARSLVG